MSYISGRFVVVVVGFYLFVISYIPLLVLRKLETWECKLYRQKIHLQKVCYLQPKEQDRGSLERETF